MLLVACMRRGTIRIGRSQTCVYESGILLGHKYDVPFEKDFEEQFSFGLTEARYLKYEISLAIGTKYFITDIDIVLTKHLIVSSAKDNFTNECLERVKVTNLSI
jgi:hypothetical protein